MVEIVKAEEKHVTAIGKLWWEFMEFHQQVEPIFIPREGAIPGFEENQVRRLMKSEEGQVLVALDGTKVVGYSLSEIRAASPGFKRGKYGYIHDTAVTASHRRKGIGKMMVAEIMRWFQANNIHRIELNAAAHNVVANSFWQTQGFKIYMHTLYKEYPVTLRNMLVMLLS
jgi:ribosomal protein S18 acetylase RimI-like enzyme